MPSGETCSNVSSNSVETKVNGHRVFRLIEHGVLKNHRLMKARFLGDINRDGQLLRRLCSETGIWLPGQLTEALGG